VSRIGRPGAFHVGAGSGVERVSNEIEDIRWCSAKSKIIEYVINRSHPVDAGVTRD
jgi:hypothetical protein